MSDVNEQEVIVETEEPEEIQEEFPVSEGSEEAEVLIDAGLTKAVDTYRKLIEANELSEKEKAELEKRIKEIESREIIETNQLHEPTEIPCEKGKISIGPPTLTRFEKARILGARALQLSLGAPPFIEIPASASTSLDIALKELEDMVIPMVIRRVLPNGDFQNIPINYFQ